mgnify:FL=1
MKNEKKELIELSKDEIIELLRKRKITLNNLSDEYCGDKEIVVEACRAFYWNRVYANEELKYDDDVILATLSNKPEYIKSLGYKYMTNKKFLIPVLKTYWPIYFVLKKDERYRDIVKDKEVLDTIFSSISVSRHLLDKYYKGNVKNKDISKEEYIKRELLNKKVIFDLYNPCGIDASVRSDLLFFKTLFGKEFSSKLESIMIEADKYFKNANLYIFNIIVKYKDDYNKLDSLMKKLNLDVHTFYTYVEKCAYFDDNMRDSLVQIIGNFFNESEVNKYIDSLCDSNNKFDDKKYLTKKNRNDSSTNKK